MEPSCSDCGHRGSFHRGGGCKVLVFDRINGARKDCNCRRIFANEASLGVSRDDLPFLPEVLTTDGPCSILPANHPALHT